MDRPLLMAIVLLFLLLLLLLMFRGWRRRQKRQAGIPKPRSVPLDAGAELLAAETFYVASTVAHEPLNRITVGGLGYRARATVRVTERGVAIAIPGQSEIFIPAGDIVAVERATWTIDRVVEEGGMVLIRWRLHDTEAPAATAHATELDSYLRLIDPGTDNTFFDIVSTLAHNNNNSNTGGRS